MSEPEPRRYWDACVFIALFIKEEGRWEMCKRLFEEAEKGKWTAVTSSLTLAESVRVKRTGVLRELRVEIEDFFERPAILLMPADRPLVIAARKLMFQFDLQSNDAIHLASAERAGCEVLYTYDIQLLNLNDRFEHLRIQEPAVDMRPTLFGDSS